MGAIVLENGSNRTACHLKKRQQCHNTDFVTSPDLNLFIKYNKAMIIDYYMIIVFYPVPNSI